MSESKKKIREINDSFLNENKIIFKKYKPIKEIGRGSFGKIYSTIRLEDQSVFAMKTESKTSYNNILETEAYYLLTLKGLGIPELISYGQNAKYNILIETLLDKSLFDLFIKPKKLCNITDLCLIALQLIERLEFVHSKDIIYRDVKPENFMIGINDPNVIYIIDFGLCKKYRSSKTGKHIQPKYIKKFIGSLKYASSHVIKGKESSRRDDLISLGFVLIHLYKRNLPWNTMFKNLDRVAYLNLIHSKETFDDGKLFHHLPEEMVDFLKYVNNLRFEQAPNYTFMKGCFQKILTRLNFHKNNINFSWINSKDIKLLPKFNSNKEESSRNRILESLEKNKSKKSTVDTDNTITPRKNENTSDENNDDNEKGKNYILKKQIKHTNEKENIQKNGNSYNNNINNNQMNQKITQKKDIYTNNNNIIFLDNNKLGYDENNKNKIMNIDKAYHRKINTFAPVYNTESNMTNLNNELTCKNNNNYQKNYPINKNKNINSINNSNGNKMHNKINKLNRLDVENEFNY